MRCVFRVSFMSVIGGPFRLVKTNLALKNHIVEREKMERLKEIVRIVRIF